LGGDDSYALRGHPGYRRELKKLVSDRQRELRATALEGYAAFTLNGHRSPTHLEGVRTGALGSLLQTPPEAALDAERTDEEDR